MSVRASSPRKLAESTAAASSRERIDAAALRLFALYGYDGVSLQAIADEVGLHKSTLFHHYKGKAELALFIVDKVIRGVVDRARPRLAVEKPALDDFVAFAVDLVDYFASEPAAAKLILHTVLAPAGSGFRAEPRENDPLSLLLVTLVSWFEAARKSGAIRYVRIRHTLMDLIGMVVFHPAAASQMPYIAGETPFSEQEREKRKLEVAALVRNALAPTS